MLLHVTINVASVERALRFYGPILAALGSVPRFAEDNWAGWQPSIGERPLFVITCPFDDGDPMPGNGQMCALAADTRALVDRCHALALDLGGIDEGGPGLRTNFKTE